MVCVAGAATAAADAPKPPGPDTAVDRILAWWPGRPKLAAYEVIDKYGPPREATPEKLVGHANGPWKRTLVTRQEIPHDFPKLHMDYVQQTIDYPVPADKADELTVFDGSVTLDRTAGEVSSRCNMEEANFLTLNLVHDILTGKKTIEEARKAFGDAEVEFALGKDPAYMKAFQFEVPKQRTADPDVPVVPGSSRRATAPDAPATGGAGMTDAEILAFVIAVNEAEVHGAAVAGKKKVVGSVGASARMLHEHHGRNLDATTKLVQKVGVTPLETPAVDKFRVESAGELADLVRLKGEAFAAGYVGLTARGHAKVLAMLDGQLLKSARDGDLKKHLSATRAEVAAHLDEAKTLQAGPKR